MSLTTDGLALGAAFAIAVGSAVQARQAYTDLNERTPAWNSLRPLLLAAIAAWFIVTIPWTTGAVRNVLLINTGLLVRTPAQLTPGQVAMLPPGQAAVLAAGKATSLTTDQAAALAMGKPVDLTAEQITAMTVEQVKDMKRWLGWLLGWLFILIGSLAAMAGAALMLAKDL
jgi:hypothetical protein